MMSPSKDTISAAEHRGKWSSRAVQHRRCIWNVDDTRKDAMLRQLINSPGQLSGSMRKLGAYAAVALLVPGGSLIAFILWASQQRAWLSPRAWRTLFALAALGTGLIVPG
jgi:hypothetical protein